jgi:hypothetical protein
LLERPFNEVLKSGKPDYSFCLGWANHSWKAKTWIIGGEDKILIEQKYPGIEDYSNHFFSVLPAFQDKRYIRVKNKPLFIIWDPDDFPDISLFIKHWNVLAKSNGLDGIYFVAYSLIRKNISNYLEMGFDSVTFDFISELFKSRSLFYKVFFKACNLFLSVPKVINYNQYIKVVLKNFEVIDNIFPCILPNYDHSPRSGKHAWVLTNATPDNFGKLLESLLIKVRQKRNEENIIFIKSWNEWGEGNYLEPDLKYGDGYLVKIHELLDKYGTDLS